MATSSFSFFNRLTKVSTTLLPIESMKLPGARDQPLVDSHPLELNPPTTRSTPRGLTITTVGPFPSQQRWKSSSLKPSRLPRYKSVHVRGDAKIGVGDDIIQFSICTT